MAMPSLEPGGGRRRGSVALGLAPNPPTGSDGPTLHVYLLGPTRVTYGDRHLDAWATGRGRAVFQYLAAHRRSRVSRDRLMNLLWPDSPPERARNSLNVAVHGLRRSLRDLTDGHDVVVYQRDTYRIDPELVVWVDLDAFAGQVAAARQCRAGGDRPGLIQALGTAIELYGGDLLDDHPYEEWTTIPREQHRLAYLDALNSLSLVRFDDGDHLGCIELCQRVLALDACREDVHSRVMLCHYHLGIPELAVRQFHSCATALRAELDMTPGPAITDLHHRIQQRQQLPSGLSA
jgi:DNA-binding SARP family transcriptional activator